MTRISGVDIPSEKRLEASLSYIYRKALLCSSYPSLGHMSYFYIPHYSTICPINLQPANIALVFRSHPRYH